ncbi:hypothetical protein NM208_g6148 [Fusarium decemcellulare]|uniref:Uncharacterized protein n=1 Tax=Fusarium decemcellulare TaxID=57161 RepID=A0ACC1SE92_9HYPO|nr:hypothetical protein NM208_g6148 [Fusarium decemcellulare]
MNPTSRQTPGQQSIPADPTNPVTPDSTSHEEENTLGELWEEAIARLKASNDDTTLAELTGSEADPQTTNHVISLPELIDQLEKQMERVGLVGRMTDIFQKAVPLLNKFAIVGDIAVSSNPVVAALPWAAVRFLLQSCTAGGEVRNKVLEGIAKITTLFFQCIIYQQFYLVSPAIESAKEVGHLRNTMVEALVRSAVFLSRALHRERTRNTIFTDTFNVRDFLDLFGELVEIGKQLSEAGDMCEKRCNLQNREKVDALYRLVTEMWGEASKRADERLQEQLKDLPVASGAAFDHIDNQADPFCLPGTRADLLKDIHRWVDSPQSPATFWLQGLAGTGKSTICRTIARDLKSETLASSFFFKKGARDRGDGAKVFSTIAYQLAQRLPQLRRHLVEAIESEPTSVTASMEVQLRKLILDPLNKLPARNLPDKVVIVIDALDECDNNNHRDTILRLLTGTNQTRLKLFITSRPEFDITTYFAIKEGPHQELVLHQVEPRTVEDDIRAVLKHAINDFASKYNQTHPTQHSQLSVGWPGDDRFQSLVRMSVPLFIAAATFIRMITDDSWAVSPERKLNFILNSPRNTSSEYGVLYGPVLNRVLVGTPHTYQSDIRQSFEKIVGSIILLANPLSATSLASLLNIEVMDIDSQLDSLRPVLDVPNGDGPVKLFHLSFRDFLLDDSAGSFQVQESKVHGSLTTECLRILTIRLKTDICGLESPGRSRFDVDTEVINRCLPPELQYASLYWVHHFKRSGSRLRDDDMGAHAAEVMKFLRSRFLNWLEALCLVGRVADSFTMMEELQSTVDEVEGVDVLKFVHDAKRFIRYFRVGIDESPLQLYHSGIIFCPENSVAPQPIEDRLYPGWITQLSAVDPDWVPYVQTLEGHRAGADCIDFLSDGRLISGSWDGTIKIWDPASGSCLDTLKKDRRKVFALASWGSIKLASACTFTLKVWDLNHSKSWLDIQPKGYITQHLAFSDDGRYLCAMSYGHGTTITELHIYELEVGERVQTFSAQMDEDASTFSRTGQWMARGEGQLIMVSRWDAAIEPTWRELGRHDGDVYSLRFSVDAKLLATTTHAGAGSTDIMIWSVATGECLHAFLGPDPSYAVPLTRLDLTANHIIVKPSRGQGTWIRPLKVGAEFRELSSNDVVFFALSPDGKLLATSHTSTPALNIWDPATVASLQSPDNHAGEVGSITFISDGSILVSASEDQVKSWEVASGVCKETSRISRTLYAPLSVAKTAPLFTSFRSTEVQIWRVFPLECILRLKFERHVGRVHHAAISADGQRVAISIYRDTEKQAVFQVWDIETRRKVDEICHKKQRLESAFRIALSSNGEQAAYTTTSTIEIRAPSRGQCVMTLDKRKWRYTKSLVFSPDGQRIADLSSGWGGAIWDLKSGECVYEWSDDPGLPNLGLNPSFISWERPFDANGPTLVSRKDVLKPYYISPDDQHLHVLQGQQFLWVWHQDEW